ncbi:MAG TPA: hypothetical protein VF937_15875, partial [Chloroflexota bacterium]
VRGVGLGFANVVRRGSIGVVGASGTGVQEITSLVHRAGAGISHAIGTGGRDLHAAVGGVTSLQAIDLLGRDPSTETIVLLSKPSDASVARRVLRALASTGKRGVACLLDSSLEMPPGVEAARSLADAARLAVAAGANAITFEPSAVPRVHLDENQRQVQGLFCGGTLCHEAALVMRESTAHEFVDFGDDHYTRGRAHPMLDPTLRNQAIVQAGANPGVGVILLDFILGLGSHPDPAGAAVPAIREAVSRAASAGRRLVVVAHVVGTERDPQDLTHQEEILRSAGAYLFPSNYEAALAASWLTEGAVA